MRDRPAFLSLVLAALATVGSAVAAPVKSSPAGSGPRNAPPADFAPQIDGSLTTSTGPGGREWAAWAFRAPGEFDIAVAFRDADGSWSVPSFVGRRDRLDEVDPVITVDGSGTVYVAFATRASGHVSLAVLPAGSSAWVGPAVISGAESASAPAVRIVGDRLIVAFRTFAGVGLAEFPVTGSPAQIFGIQDGPDGVDPLGLVPKWGDKPGKGDIPPPPVE
jgi:hypothetical protein